MSALASIPVAEHWPFPGSEGQPMPPSPPLPPARFAVGDAVTTRWGRAVVIAVHNWALLGGRAYLVKHSWSSAPPGFGHCFGEEDIEPAQPSPPVLDQEPAPTWPGYQLDLFA